MTEERFTALRREHRQLKTRKFFGPELTGADRRRLARVFRSLVRHEYKQWKPELDRLREDQTGYREHLVRSIRASVFDLDFVYSESKS